MNNIIDSYNAIYNPLATEVEGFDSLAELALDLQWSWNHGTDELWRQLDPVLWELTRNPWVILQTSSKEKLQQVLADPNFRKKVEAKLHANKEDSTVPLWFQQNYPKTSLTCVAYFSMEFMLSEALPIYSGGLGNVAGDQLKAASDMGIPLVAVGLLYQQGYFRQIIDKDGRQQELFPYNDPGQLPILPLRHENREWVRFKIDLPGYSVWLRAWQVQVGRLKLYLLDSNDAANPPAYRGITSELYGGSPELRLKQEILLGIGGWRLLDLLNIHPEVCHLNEGHAAFAVLERAYRFMQNSGQSFEVALSVTRVGNLFTTHTAVPAGFDRFDPSLIIHYLGDYAEQKLGLSGQNLLALGRQNANDLSESFNMAYLAVRGSGAVNGVSQLHGKVSRHIFLPLFPQWPEVEIPVGSVTNGVHMPTWDSAPADELWTKACGKERWMGNIEKLEHGIHQISDEVLWEFRMASSQHLVEYTRERLSQQLTEIGATTQEIEKAKNLFDPHVLTMGFARRFASYKRPNLLLHNPERLLGILTRHERPLQLIIAGKAHPADEEGKRLIQEWSQFIQNNDEARAHVIFLSDYDMHLTQELVQGVDIWLNTPRRPWEACGTSGMKVLVNGGLNFSELDGWWVEAFTQEVGWALGDGLEHHDDPNVDAYEADKLYELLEQQIIPEFYTRDNNNIPTPWVKRMRESMAKLTPQFSTSRTVQEYTEKHYFPAADNYTRRAADKGKIGKLIVECCHHLEQKWDTLHFGEVKVETTQDKHLFEVPVYLNDFDSEKIRVELYAEGLQGTPPIKQEMIKSREIDHTQGGYIYSGDVSLDRPVADYTVRMIPSYEGMSIPLETSQILWQR